jgi:hypothetical protein
MLRNFKRRPSPAMAVAFVALLAALSGTAVALPGKNTVDSGDLKKNAVRNADIRNNAVNGKKVKNSSLASGDVKNESLTGGDVKNDSLIGSDINESTLGKVPSAATADLANTVAASEAYHEVGTAGNPSFGAGCTNAVVSGAPDVFEKAAFYKDLEGVVHLRGMIECDPGATSDATNIAFQLPAGYRPRNGKLQVFPNAIGGNSTPPAPLFVIAGAGIPAGTGLVIPDGGVAVSDGNTSLDGTSFRAEG